MTVEKLIEQILDEAMRLGQKPHGAYRSYWEIYNPIVTFFKRRGEKDYSAEIMDEYVEYTKEKFENGKINRGRYSRLTTAARRVSHFERTGTYLWNVPKRGSRYELNEYYSEIVKEFLDSDSYHPNTLGDIEWTAKRYFHWLQNHGIENIEQADAPTIQKYLFDCSEQMKSASVYNVHLYLKKLYRFLYTAGYIKDSYDVFFSFIYF